MPSFRSQPKNHKVVRVYIPDQADIEELAVHAVQTWNDEDMAASRAFGDQWVRENRTAVLKVPSVVTAGRESNLIFNTAHPQFGLITAGRREPVYWDARMFRLEK